MILAAARANARTAVAVMAGSAVMMEAWRREVGALLLLWYPGMEGGTALANVLLGAVNPSGRLPFHVPAREADLPFFDRDAREIVYDAWHGLARFDRDGSAPAFPFGFGLSYGSFACERASAHREGEDALVVEVEVSNRGAWDGEVVLQAYAGALDPPPDGASRRLCGFRREALAAGETRRCSLRVELRDLAHFDVDARCWRLSPGAWRLQVGTSSAPTDLRETTLHLPERDWPLRAG
jgi:beta-glucosidase